MSTIKIPPVLRGSVGGEKEVQASGSREQIGQSGSRRTFSSVKVVPSAS